MRGMMYALGAYAMWGCFPLFFHLLSHIGALEVLAYRVLFAFSFVLLLLIITLRFERVMLVLKSRTALLWSVLASAIISVNWFVFIWAVSEHRVVETSLGYFITPLVSLFIGRVVLKEQINRYQMVAGVIATMAILFELIALGGIPWVSLVLAFSFGLYGLVRKVQPIDSLTGLFFETLWVLPLALIVVMNVGVDVHYDISTYSLFIASGIITAIPLLLFAASVRRINLVVAGFIMYLNPLMQFMTAVWILNEFVPSQRYVTFVLIWIAMIFFITGLLRKTP